LVLHSQPNGYAPNPFFKGEFIFLLYKIDEKGVSLEITMQLIRSIRN